MPPQNSMDGFNLSALNAKNVCRLPTNYHHAKRRSDDYNDLQQYSIIDEYAICAGNLLSIFLIVK
jgi:hypothetical protein